MAATAHTLAGPDVRAQARTNRATLRLWHLACAGATLFVVGLAFFQNDRFSLATLVLAVVLAVAVIRPGTGLYGVVFLAVLGDPVVTGWYPFTKNFSTAESVLFFGDRLIISPLELGLLALTLGWLLQMWGTSSWRIERGRLLRPLLAFTAFVTVGLLTGIARGGIINVAHWEARALFYIPVVYLLVANLTKGDPGRLERLWWWVVGAVLVNGAFAWVHLQGMSAAERSDLESLVTHSAAVAMNAVFLLVIAAWLFRPSSTFARVVLPLLAVPTLVAYLVSERRVAIAGLFASLAMVGIVLFWTRRRAFYVVAPVAIVLGVGYLGAFWNSTGTLAAPALAAKTIIAPDDLDEKDYLSNLYRVVENANLSYTIETSPLLGVGFGRPFLRPYALPGINPFLLAQYMPHNAILWVWLKTGVFGFIAFLYLMASTMRRGAEACLRTAGTRAQFVAVTAIGFVVSLLVFTYGDIAWDAHNMVILGLAMAHLDLLSRARPQPEAGEPVTRATTPESIPTPQRQGQT
jgi:hypothetical protein